MLEGFNFSPLSNPCMMMSKGNCSWGVARAYARGGVNPPWAWY